MLQVGQAVTVKRGGFAEYATTGVANCFPVRDASAEAVAVALSGLTAAAALLVSLPRFQPLARDSCSCHGILSLTLRLRGCSMLEACNQERRCW